MKTDKEICSSPGVFILSNVEMKIFFTEQFTLIYLIHVSQRFPSTHISTLGVSKLSIELALKIVQL